MKMLSRSIACTVASGLVAAGVAASALAQSAFVNGAPAAAADASLRQAAAEAVAARKLDIAESILSQRETETGRPLDARYRAFLKADLAALSEDELETVQIRGPLANLRQAVSPNTLGDTSADLVYTPVAPCRVFDTRSSVAGMLAGGTQQNFLVAGTTGFPSQGGNGGGCGIPLGTATSVMINFAAVTPTGSGNLRAWAVASPQPAAPTAAVMNFSPAMDALANGVVVPICDPAATACTAGDLRLQANASSVHVVGDVLGYFARVSSPRTSMLITNGETSGVPTFTPAFLKTLGTFTKAVASSDVVITWQGHVRQSGTPGSTFCQLQLRVDGAAPTGVQVNGYGSVVYGDDTAVSQTGRWTGLGTGSRTVSLYLRGSATSCTVNYLSFWMVTYVVEQ